MVTPVQVTAESCFNTARMLLNDQNIQLWSDPVLMPMMYQAHLELQQKLKSRASPVMRAYADVVVAPLTTALPPNTPGDLTLPIRIMERPFGSSVDFELMTETDILPVVAVTTNLTWWSWVQDAIMFVGATLATEIVIDYWRRIPVPTAASDPIGIIDGDQYLAPRIAAIAAASVGEENTSSVATALAEAQLQIVMMANKGRSPQMIGTSIRP